MLLVVGILLTIILGFLLVNSISVQFSLPEKIGLSFPLGMLLETFLMLLLDSFSIPLTAYSVLGIEVFATLGLGSLVFLRRKEYAEKIKHIRLQNIFKGYNLIWLVLLLLIVYMEYLNFSKCMFFPPSDRDGLACFEPIGYISAQEGCYKNLYLFDGQYNPSMRGPGSALTYLPLLQLSYAFVYLLGAETSKIIPALFFAFFLLAFYGICARKIGKTAAMIATLFTLLTPEMIAFSSLSITNVVHAVFASLGIIYIASWLQGTKEEEKNYKDLLIGSVLLAGNSFCRTEGIVFVGTVYAALFIHALIRKKYKRLIIPALICLFPFLYWMVFSQIFHLTSEGVLITHPFWDPHKFEVIKLYALSLYKNQAYYGITFVALILSLLSNLWFIYKKKDNLYLLFMIILSSFFYYLILYQIEYKWDLIENVLAYSAKRFLFCFIPIIWFFVFSNQSIKYIFQKLEKFLQL